MEKFFLLNCDGRRDLQLLMVQRLNGSWLALDPKQDFDAISSKTQGTLQKKVQKGTGMGHNIERRASKGQLLGITVTANTDCQQLQMTH